MYIYIYIYIFCAPCAFPHALIQPFGNSSARSRMRVCLLFHGGVLLMISLRTCPPLPVFASLTSPICTSSCVAVLLSPTLSTAATSASIDAAAACFSSLARDSISRRNVITSAAVHPLLFAATVVRITYTYNTHTHTERERETHRQTMVTGSLIQSSSSTRIPFSMCHTARSLSFFVRCDFLLFFSPYLPGYSRRARFSPLRSRQRECVQHVDIRHERFQHTHFFLLMFLVLPFSLFRVGFILLLLGGRVCRHGGAPFPAYGARRVALCEINQITEGESVCD